MKVPGVRVSERPLAWDQAGGTRPLVARRPGVEAAIGPIAASRDAAGPREWLGPWMPVRAEAKDVRRCSDGVGDCVAGAGLATTPADYEPVRGPGRWPEALLDRRARTSAPRPYAAAGAVSLILHLGILLALVPVPAVLRPVAPPPQQRQIEMVFVRQPEIQKGAPPAPPTQAAAAPDAGASQSLVSAEAASPLSSGAGTRSRSRAPASPHWQTSMLDDPGDGPQDEDAYSVRSDDIRPARPDSAFRNEPPRYPATAERAGLRGTVDVLVEVRPDGRAGDVEVTSSSGVESLDRAATEALSKWRFQPQMSGSTPVASQFRIAIHYDGRSG